MHPTPRHIGLVNWIGLWTLYVKEVQRFAKIPGQTMLAPVMSTMLFLVIFEVALGSGRRGAGGVPFDVFLAPGLVMMAVTQNAYQNASSSILISKIQGNIVDLVMTPLNAGELLLAFCGAAVTRGFAVAVCTLAALAFIVDLPFQSPVWALAFLFLGSLLLGLLGVLTGLWAEKFDHMATISNFVVLPLAFLSGTFYSIANLPPLAQSITQFNPYYYAIDGFRQAIIGHGDFSPWTGFAVLLACNAVLFFWTFWLILRGYKLKD